MIWFALVAAWLVNFGWVFFETVKEPKNLPDENDLHGDRSRSENRCEQAAEAKTSSPTMTVLAGSGIAESGFFVARDCDGCGVCKAMAPGFFQHECSNSPYFIRQQPRTRHEVNLLREISSRCPQEALRETSIPELESIRLGLWRN